MKLETMYDIPLTATIESSNYGEVLVNIITLEDGTLWINTNGQPNLTGPYDGDEGNALTDHFQRGE